MIFLDTNTVIFALNSRPRHIRVKLTEMITAGSAVSISSIVLFEMQYGVEKSDFRQRSADRLSQFVSEFVDVIAFDNADAMEAGNVRAYLERRGTPIGPYDLLIAAQARRRDALLVTANTREFARVPGLRIEDWMIPNT